MVYIFLRDAKKMSAKGNLEPFNPKKYSVDQLIDALKALCYQKYHPSNGPIWLDQKESPDPKFLIPFRNGLLNLTEWLQTPSTELIPHSPSLLNGYALPFDFTPQGAQICKWATFLDALWPNDSESKELLQEWMGYLLLQDTSMQKILLIIGPPRSGKGTIGRITRELLGSFDVVGPTLSSLSGEFGLEPLLNKSLALISDARLSGNSGNHVIIERLLSISGEDPLTINRKYNSPLTVQLPTRLMLMSNELPDIKDPSGALANRYVVLTLKNSWLGKEDPMLFAHLQVELPDILTWALEGLKRLKKRGCFKQPASSHQTIEDLEAVTSPIRSFVSERCILSPNKLTVISELYHEWCTWCLESGFSKPGSVQLFGKNLRTAYPELYSVRPQEDYNRTRVYKGIALRENVQASEDVRSQPYNPFEISINSTKGF